VDVGRSFSGADQTEQTAWVWQPETTSSASYNRTQDAIMRRNTPGVQTGQEGPGYRAAEAVVPGGRDLTAFDDYLSYLRDMLANAGPQGPFR